MNRKHAFAVAAAAFLAVPAFAQSTTCFLNSSNLQMTCPSTTILGAGPAITSSNGAFVSSGTGLIVTPGATISNVVVAPSAEVALATTPGYRVLPGAATIEAAQTTAVLGAGPATLAVPATVGSQVLVTRYWVNVPAGAEHRADFQRWMNLKP